MSEKKRRDITLGEMQDECKKHRHGECNNCTKCDPIIKKICDDLDFKSPCGLDLTDPPRFNEAQMALLEAFYGIGIRTVFSFGGAVWNTLDESGNHVSIIKKTGIREGETLDLTELLGKDSQ